MDTSITVSPSLSMYQRLLEHLLSDYLGSIPEGTTPFGRFLRDTWRTTSPLASCENLTAVLCLRQLPGSSLKETPLLGPNQIRHLSLTCETRLRGASKTFGTLRKERNCDLTISLKGIDAGILRRFLTSWDGHIEFIFTQCGFFSLTVPVTSLLIWLADSKTWIAVGERYATGWVLFTSRFLTCAMAKYTVHRWIISILRKLGIWFRSSTKKTLNYLITQS